MLKFTFNALIQQKWLRPLHTAEKHHPTMFHTATVRPTRSGPNILYNTSLSKYIEDNLKNILTSFLPQWCECGIDVITAESQWNCNGMSP